MHFLLLRMGMVRRVILAFGGFGRAIPPPLNHYIIDSDNSTMLNPDFIIQYLTFKSQITILI